MTAVHEVLPATVAPIPAEFVTLIQPVKYTSKRTQKDALAHNIEFFIEGVGTGRMYVPQDLYFRVSELGLRRGDAVVLVIGLHSYNGELTPRLLDVLKAS